jgi:hypothetical protein
MNIDDLPKAVPGVTLKEDSGIEASIIPPEASAVLPATEGRGGNDTILGTLDPRILVGDWHRIEFSGVIGEPDVAEIFVHLRAQGVFGVRVRRNKSAKGQARAKKKIILAFKSQQRRDAVLSAFLNSERSLWTFDAAVALGVDHQEALGSFRWILDPEYVEMCFAHQQSAEDLGMMLERAPPCREIGNLRELHPFPHPPEVDSGIRFFIRYRFLEFNRFPPVVLAGHNPPPRVLDRVCFPTAWLLTALDEVYSIERRRLMMIVCAHTDRYNQTILPFWVPLYVTNGPYDALVRELAQRAKIAADGGDPAVQYSRPARPRHMEAIGFLDSQSWFIDWDSSSPQPSLYLNIGEAIFNGSR